MAILRPLDKAWGAGSLSTCQESTACLPKGGGVLGVKDKGRQGQGKEPVAGSLMAPKKNYKAGELWGHINRAVRH
jgi:hypothetical protein